MAKKDLWRPQDIDLRAVKDMVEIIRGMCKRLEREAHLQSINLDLTYGNMFTAIEDLYGILNIDKLAADNKRRHDKHMKETR